jgi:hypothetical protein
VSSISNLKPLGRGFGIKFIPRRKGLGYARHLVFTEWEDAAGGVECLECGRTRQRLPVHLRWVHSMTTSQYRERHGADTPVLSGEALMQLSKASSDSASVKHQRAQWGVCPGCGKTFERKPRRNIGALNHCSFNCWRSQQIASLRLTSPLGVAASRGKQPRPHQDAIRRALSAGPLATGDLCQRTGLSPKSALHALKKVGARQVRLWVLDAIGGTRDAPAPANYTGVIPNESCDPECVHCAAWRGK